MESGKIQYQSNTVKVMRPKPPSSTPMRDTVNSNSVTVKGGDAVKSNFVTRSDTVKSNYVTVKGGDVVKSNFVTRKDTVRSNYIKLKGKQRTSPNLQKTNA